MGRQCFTRPVAGLRERYCDQGHNGHRKPLQDIACKQDVLEQGGHFTLIDVRHEEVGENACNRGPGLVWTLKANNAIRTDQASEFLKKFRTKNNRPGGFRAVSGKNSIEKK